MSKGNPDQASGAPGASGSSSPARRRSSFWRTVRELAGFTVGVALIALALNWFLVPNRIAAGGVSGLATVLYHVFGWPVGQATLAINIPLFLVGWRFLGFTFGARSVLGFVMLAFIVDLTAPYTTAITHEPVLAAIFGGGMTGIGVGITYRYRGSTGGTVLAARLLYRFLGIGTGQALLLLDGLVILLAGIAFSTELALYALLAVLVQTRAIDLVEEGQPYGKAAWIICENAEAVASRILKELDRGVTALEGLGMYTRQRRPVLLVSVARAEISTLKRLIREEDPKAFVIITDAFEVIGEGFTEP